MYFKPLVKIRQTPTFSVFDKIFIRAAPWHMTAKLIILQSRKLTEIADIIRTYDTIIFTLKTWFHIIFREVYFTFPLISPIKHF